MGMTCDLYALDDGELLAARAGRLAVARLYEREGCSLEKAWHGIHFTLVGSNDGEDTSLGFILGGTPVGPDAGYGPPRLHSPGEVRDIAAALSAISDKEFATRFDVSAMEEEGVYPMIWDEPAADLLAEYGHYFAAMKAYVVQAAKDGKGILVVLA